MGKLIQERLAQHVSRTESDCWLWTGSKDEGGYGRVFYQRKNRKAHRVSYQIYVGQIPDSLFIDHLCRNRACINPAHLEPVTHIENCRRGAGGLHAKHRHDGRTHCSKGHPLLPDTSRRIVHPNGGRSWKCNICERGWRKKSRDARKIAKEAVHAVA